MRGIDLDAERTFENRKALGEEIRAAQSKFYWATAIPTERHNQETFTLIGGKRVLEIGCASGADAVQYARHAEKYVGVDISDRAIANAVSLGLDNAEFLCIDGHKIPLPDGAFDCVVSNSLLHHMDLHTVIPEIHRLLGEDGVLVFREPLGTNPLFQLYRRVTQSARTVDERPFTWNDIRFLQQYFDLQEVRWFGFLSVASAFVRVPSLRAGLTLLDEVLSRTPLRRLYWQFSGFARRRSLGTPESGGRP